MKRTGERMKSGRQKIRAGDERTGRRVGGRREEVDGGEAEVMLISGLEHLLQPSETTTPAGRTAAGDRADKAGPRSAPTPPAPATKTRPVRGRSRVSLNKRRRSWSSR